MHVGLQLHTPQWRGIIFFIQRHNCSSSHGLLAARTSRDAFQSLSVITFHCHAQLCFLASLDTGHDAPVKPQNIKDFKARSPSTEHHGGSGQPSPQPTPKISPCWDHPESLGWRVCQLPSFQPTCPEGTWLYHSAPPQQSLDAHHILGSLTQNRKGAGARERGCLDFSTFCQHSHMELPPECAQG